MVVRLFVGINISTAFFPRSLPQCRIHSLGVSEEFSTNRRPLAELDQQKLNWAIHPRGSTKMSLFHDCGEFWKRLLVCNVRAPLKGKCDYVIAGSPRWTDLRFPDLQQPH